MPNSRSSSSATTAPRNRPPRNRARVTARGNGSESSQRANRVPGYKLHADATIADKLGVLGKAIDNLATSLDSFESRADRRKWQKRMRRASKLYEAGLHSLPAAKRQSKADFQYEVLSLLRNPLIVELAVAREVYFARRKRLRGKGPRGMWIDTDGRWRQKPPTVQRIRALARSLSVDQPSVPVHRQVQTKPKGHRVTFAFSLADQAMKRLVADIIEIVCQPNGFDFGRAQKGGQHGAAVAIRNSISRGSSRYFAVADLRDAYPSITARHIADIIPLPSIVIRNVITVPADLTNVSSAFPPPTGRRLPQGAVSSASILSVLLGRSLRQIAGPHRMIVNQGDDVAIGTPTRAEAVLALRELTEGLRSLRAGPLRFGRSEVQSPFSREKLSFCGYSHRWFYDSERLHCAPSDKSVEKMKVKLRSKLQRTPPRRRERAQRSYLRAWSAAFPCWTKNEYSVASIETTANMIRMRVRMAEIDRQVAD